MTTFDPAPAAGEDASGHDDRQPQVPEHEPGEPAREGDGERPEGEQGELERLHGPPKLLGEPRATIYSLGT